MNPFQGAFILGRHRYGTVSFIEGFGLLCPVQLLPGQKREKLQKEKKIVLIGYESWIYEE